MIRQCFQRRTPLVLAGLLACIPLLSLAQSSSGSNQYQKIIPAQPTVSGARHEIVEIFWYGCPHCFRFLPFVERYLKKKPETITWVRVPGILRENWAIHARAYYTAEALGVIDAIHQPLFDAIHAQKRKLDTEQSLMDFFKEHGVSNEAFKKTFHSFSVDAKVRRARELGKRFGVTGTPTLVINGQYRTDGSICRCGYNEQLKIAERLALQP